jgi:DNA invertase Pin-like site-specific DNA recombinase
MVQVLAAFSEFEQAQIRERVTAGLRHAKRLHPPTRWLTWSG